MDNQPHGLQTGQSVVFKEVNGMVELNGTVRHVSGIIFQVSLYVHVQCLANFRFFSDLLHTESVLSISILF